MTPIPQVNALARHHGPTGNRTIPVQLWNAFTGNDGVFRHRQGTSNQMAFVDTGETLIAIVPTASSTVRVLVDIALVRDWEVITVMGEAAFCRAAFLEANALGIEVEGYTASAEEREQAQWHELEKLNPYTQPWVVILDRIEQEDEDEITRLLNRTGL